MQDKIDNGPSPDPICFSNRPAGPPGLVERRSRPALSYLRAGRLLHCITLAEMILLLFVGPGLLAAESDHWALTVRNKMILLFLLSLPVLSQLDARCRYQNYKRVKEQLFQFGFDARILKPLIKSRCQRDAAWVAADELGYGRLCLSFYRARGYRWYHVLPDFLFSDPLFLASRQFWQSTFFLKTHRSSRLA